MACETNGSPKELKRLIQWLNNVLDTNYTGTLNLRTGVPYAQLCKYCYPEMIEPNEINLNARTEYEFYKNFKVIQKTLKFAGRKHVFSIFNLIKCKIQSHCDLLLWFKDEYEKKFEQLKFAKVDKKISDILGRRMEQRSMDNDMRSKFQLVRAFCQDTGKADDFNNLMCGIFTQMRIPCEK